MPVYVYECDVCGKRFERHRHFGAPHPDTCPDGHTGVRRVFSPPAIIFKGSGFFATDNARSNGRASHSPSKEKEPTKPGKQASKSRTKETEEA